MQLEDPHHQNSNAARSDRRPPSWIALRVRVLHTRTRFVGHLSKRHHYLNQIISEERIKQYVADRNGLSSAVTLAGGILELELAGGPG